MCGVIVVGMDAGVRLLDGGSGGGYLMVWLWRWLACFSGDVVMILASRVVAETG